jgi:hypothetical protein
MGEWKYSSTIVNLGTRYEWWDSRPQKLLPGILIVWEVEWAPEPIYFPLPEIKPQILGRPANNLVAIHIELFRLRFKGKETRQKRTVEWRKPPHSSVQL